MSNTPGSSIAGPSQQNPDEPSREYTPISSLDNVSSLMNPPDKSVMSFSFQVRAAEELKEEIETLCDSGVAVAKFHVSELGLEISVAKFHGTLWDSYWKPASDLINFQCRRPSTEPLVVYLLPVSWVLRRVHNDDTLTVYQLDGSNNLSIMCERSKPCSRLSFNFPSVNLDLPLEPGQQLNPPDDNNRSFSFQLWRARVLKQGIRVLCDSGVNRLGLAYIHADDNGFQITVDTEDGCAGVLLLPAKRFRNFQCSKPSTVAQIVNLAEVSWNLSPVDEEDTVTVYQVDGSNQLSFMFECGSAPKSVAILSTNVYNFPGFIGRFPQIVTYCEDRVLAFDLRWTIQTYAMEADDGCPVVSIEIGGDEPIFCAMDMGNWNAEFQRIVDLEKKNPRGQKYRVWFHCNFVSTLRAACDELVDNRAEVEVCFSLVPEGHVVFQFNPAETGNVLILKRALAFYPDADDIESLTTVLGRFKVTY